VIGKLPKAQLYVSDFSSEKKGQAHFVYNFGALSNFLGIYFSL